MIGLLQKIGRWLLEPLRRVLEQGFGPRLNPLNHLGALNIYFFWVVLISGIWLFIFFKTSVAGAYASVEYLTHEQWYLGGVMRSLHRYASDAAVITLVLHMLREFAYDRHRGMRWFSWVTGVPLLWLVIPLGITGYWLVWDQLGWYVALTSAELMDSLPIFSESMARNFLSDAALSDRFFTLMAFMHLIGLPLFLVFGIWLHVLRINGPRINPPRALMAGSLVAMVALSFVFPAVSQGEVDMSTVPDSLGLDWYYLLVYPLAKAWSPGWVWGLLVGFSLLLCALPWIAPMRGKSPAQVDLDNCNGCARCADDCPFGAITMQPRSDGKAYEIEAVVDPALCMSCGLCTGACPTATPFRRHSALIPGIDMPDLPATALRESIMQAAAKLQGERRILVFGCRENAQSRRMKAIVNDAETATLDVICSGHLPPPFVDFILSRKLADGIVVAGCPGGDCQYRFGTEWTSLRMARQRDPHLRKRVDSARLALAWEDRWQGCQGLPDVVAALRASLPAADQPGEPCAPRRPPRIVRHVFAAAAYAVFFALVAWLSVWPRFHLIDAGHAMVSLSFSHAGQRIRECRTLTQEELDKLPPNMRKPQDCPRERLPVRVLFAVNDATLFEATLAPTGLWNDGSANLYRRLEVPAGTQKLFIGMNERGQADGFDYSLAQVVDLAPGQHVVVEFDDQRKAFELRLE
jgi:quinol-cytochrome oxidoreductase complex cytochrome b subunit/coenzyme F420-reducing hydrogenase delta subunit/ferredoxin